MFFQQSGYDCRVALFRNLPLQMTSIIRVSGLCKQYGPLKAVDDLSFTVEKGCIYGFLGQNGAGKSTTIRMLLTLVNPTSGGIEIFGMQLKRERQAILRQIGAVIEKPDLYKYLTGAENLSLFARMSGIRVTPSQLGSHLDRVGLADRANSKVKTYSQGMKQRLGLAVAMIHNPPLLILDEPTNGLDPQGIADVRNLLLRLSREEQKTILISSHLLSEMELMADSMLILDKGRNVAEGPVKQLFETTTMQVRCEIRNLSFIEERIKLSPWNNSILRIKGQTVFFKMSHQQVPQLLKDLISINAEVMAIQPVHSLEEYFLSLTSANQHVDPVAD